MGKATEHLIGEGIKPEQLNDSRIGRVLDQLYKKGLTSVFVEIALAVVKRFGVNTKQVHLDSSSSCVQGEYLNSEPENEEGTTAPSSSSSETNHPSACETDAVDAAKLFAKKLKYHRLTNIEVQLKPHYEQPGRPRKGDDQVATPIIFKGL